MKVNISVLNPSSKFFNKILISLIKVHVMRKYWGGGMLLHVGPFLIPGYGLRLDSRSGCFTLGRELLVPLLLEVGWDSKPLWQFWRRNKFLPQRGFELRFLGRSFLSLVTTPTELFSQLKLSRIVNKILNV